MVRLAVPLGSRRKTITALSQPARYVERPDLGSCTPMIDPITMKEYAGPALDRFQRFTTLRF